MNSSSNKKPLHGNKNIPSKLVTRDTSSLSNPSFRVYYGKAKGSVPFLWESQPGTPKHTTTTTTANPSTNDVDQYAFPPLTPPPSSYYYSDSIKKKIKSHNLLHIILPKLTLRRPNNLSYTSTSSSSCSSSELSSPAVGQKRRAATARLFSPKTHLFSNNKEEGSHASMLCFGAWW